MGKFKYVNYNFFYKCISDIINPRDLNCEILLILTFKIDKR